MGLQVLRPGQSLKNPVQQCGLNLINLDLTSTSRLIYLGKTGQAVRVFTFHKTV